MDTLDTLAVLLPTDIYQVIIFSGIIYFILFFYGTKQWEKYSEFDKVVFSVIFGGFVFYFLILPVSIFLFVLNVFQKPQILISNDLSIYSYAVYFILAIYLIWWRLLKTNNRPLSDNDTFMGFTELLIAVTLLLLALMDVALFVAFSFSTYQEFLGYILLSIISLVLLFSLYHIFLKIFHVKGNIFHYSDKKPYLNLILNNKMLWVSIVLIISVVAALIGTHFLKTTTQLVDEQKTTLEIPRIETWNRSNISGDFDIAQKYKITFGLIPWIKFRPNISLIDESGKPYHPEPEPDYYLAGEYVIVNGSRMNSTNITLVGKKHEDNLPKIYKLEAKDLNDSVKRWNLIFTNPYDLYIKIDAFDIMM